MEQISDAFRALGDPTRLRIMRLLQEAPLNVSEIVSLVGVGQSSVSHHLSKLKGLELISEERQAGYTYYSVALGERDVRWPLLRVARDADDDHGDRARLNELLRQREDRQALNERLLEPGQSWMLWSHAMAALLPALDVVDFGCGTGALTVEMARWAKRVVGIDRSTSVLAKAAERVAHQGAKNVTFLEADLAKLPLPAAKKDVVVLSQSLHHVENPAAVLNEAARILVPGGKVLLLELMPHDEHWVLERLGHMHAGFEPESLKASLRRAGFQGLKLTVFPKEGSSPFRLFLLTGAKK
jgi:ArsR family transcriptional regulator